MNTLEAIFYASVDTSWRASCLILLVLGLRRWLRSQISARLLFWVWIAVALRLVLPFSLPVTWSPFNATAWSQFFGHALKLPVTKAPAPEVTSSVEEDGGITLRAEAGLPVATRSLSEWAVLAWCGGAATLLLVRVSACLRFGRKLRRSAVPARAGGPLISAEVASLLHASAIPVVITAAVRAPALYGIFRPRILFPPGFLEKFSPLEIRLTLAHELAHARRRDLLADAILHLAAVVHWFNPLVWLVARAARQDCELACDESVLVRATEGERECYGATLLRIVRFTTEVPSPGFTLGVVACGKQIKRRIQMIVANKSFTLARLLLGGAIAAALTGLSFTSESIAQTPIRNVAPVAPSNAAAGSNQPSFSSIVYDASSDRLDTLFPTGIVATVADHAITVAEVRRYIAPVIPKLQRDVHTQEEFNGKLTLLQNSAVKDLVARTLLIRQFHDQRSGEVPKHIAAIHIDTVIADSITERFGGDRAKFLSDLKERGLTMHDYRKEVEDDIIYNYMRSQERKIAGPVDRAKSDPAVERPIRLRMIQLTRTDADTDVSLLAKANAIVARLHNGESFEGLAKEFDQSKKRERGGDWGWLGPADVRTEYRDAFLALRKGDISAPILTPEACMLMYADDRR